MITLHIGRCLSVARKALAGLSIGLALFCASGSSSAQVADWDKVIAAAKAEGGLVLYTALLGVPSTKAIAKAFEAKYGIPVQVLEARASELRERIRTEQSAGRYLGDVMFNSENQAIILAAEDKSIVPHEPVPNAAGLTRAVSRRRPQVAGHDHQLWTVGQQSAGASRGGAEELARPDRSEMEGQDLVRRHAGGRRRLCAVFRDRRKTREGLSRGVGDPGHPVHARTARSGTACRARGNGHLHAVHPGRHSEPQGSAGSHRDARGRRTLRSLCDRGHERRAASECRAALYRFLRCPTRFRRSSRRMDLASCGVEFSTRSLPRRGP